MRLNGPNVDACAYCGKSFPPTQLKHLNIVARLGLLAWFVLSFGSSPGPVGILKDRYCPRCLVKAHFGAVLLVVSVLGICFVGLWMAK